MLLLIRSPRCGIFANVLDAGLEDTCQVVSGWMKTWDLEEDVNIGRDAAAIDPGGGRKLEQA